MRHNKFYLILLSFLILSLGLSACGNSTNMKPADSSKGVNEAEQEQTEESSSVEQTSVVETSGTSKAEASASEAANADSEKTDSPAKPDQATELESLGELRDELDDKVAYQEVMAKEDGTYSFQELEIADFKAWLEAQDKPVFLDFWAPWCQPCMLASPEIDKLAAEYGQDLKVIKANVEGIPADVSSEFKISGIPHFTLIKDGEVQADWEGYSEERLTEMKESITQLIG